MKLFDPIICLFKIIYCYSIDQAVNTYSPYIFPSSASTLVFIIDKTFLNTLYLRDFPFPTL